MTCQHCQRVVVIPASKVATRRYCDRVCQRAHASARRARRLEKRPATCGHCQHPLTPKQRSASHAVRYCSLSCARRERVTRERRGPRIAALRRERGWTQYDLAAAVGVCRNTVSRWERDAARIQSVDHVRGLADVLEIDP